MSSDPKATTPPSVPPPKQRDHGIRIFTYPKLIFIFPTFVAALICGIGMKLSGDQTTDPLRPAVAGAAEHPHRDADAPGAEAKATTMQKHQRFMTPTNLFGVLFLGILSFNLLIMAIDFPRFTVVAIFLVILLGLFVLLWIGAYWDFDLMDPAKIIFGNVYVIANAGFYFMFAGILAVIFAIIYITRFLDYWEIMPNEILHHHGPLSDLERYPTLNLKFDKEIPDVFEFLFLGAGRLVLHVTEERKAIVLDNVLFINRKEEGLKRLMSRLEVRVTTDQEVAEP
jgi:hypothetical protein